MKKNDIHINKIDLYDFHNMFEQDIVISYKGPFHRHILAVISDYIRSTITEDPKASKKIFNIFMELAENISHYSIEKSERVKKENVGIGTLVLGEYDDYYTLMIGNMVKRKDIIPVIEKCELINTLDRESLRKFKIEQRNLPRSENNGANIGLIKVALTATTPLDFQVTKVNEEFAYFAISIDVKKDKKR